MPSLRDTKAERARRVRSATERSTTLYRQRISARPIRGVKDLARLTPAQQAARIRAVRAVSLMRERNLPLSKAAREAGSSREAVLRYFGDQLSRRGRRLVALKPVTGPFVMVIASTDGVVERVVRGQRSRSAVGKHHAAIRVFLGGEVQALDAFKGKRVAGVELETDPDRIVELWRLGELDFLEIYRLAS